MYFLIVVAIALALKLHGADAGAVLMGIQVTPQNASDADFESYLSRAVTIAQRSAPYFRSLGHNFSTFVCISPGVSIRQRILLLNKCFLYGIPHIAVSSAAMEASGVCTIEHPDLERYDALFHLNFDTTMSYFDFEAPGFDENYFVAPTVDIVEAKLLYRALYLPPNSSRRSVSSIIVDLLKDSNFSLLVYLPVHISPASPTTDPRFPLFQPAASESVQKSGMCSLQWPRNGTEQYSMNKKHQTVYLWNKWIIDCDIDPEPDEQFTISFVGKVIPGFEQVTFSGSRFHGGELILPHLVKADIGKSEDVLGLSLVLSSRQRVLADFSFHFKVVFSESSESTSSLVNAMISQAPHRLDIGTFLNGLCLLGTLIEVGFSDEAFTSALLGQWMGASYVAVTYGTSQENIIVLNNLLHKHSEKASLLNANSSTVRALFADNSVDVICIQSVEYHDVLSDLQIWWPKIKLGGVVYGREYSIPHNGSYRFINNRHTAGPAVDEFSSRMNTVRYITLDEAWYIVKPLT